LDGLKRHGLLVDREKEMEEVFPVAERLGIVSLSNKFIFKDGLDEAIRTANE